MRKNAFETRPRLRLLPLAFTDNKNTIFFHTMDIFNSYNV